ncbi:unnamed protein product, partial [Musa textilis]
HTLSPRDNPPHRATKGSLASPGGTSPITRARKGSSPPGEIRHKSLTGGGRRFFPVVAWLGPAPSCRMGTSGRSVYSPVRSTGQEAGASGPFVPVTLDIFFDRPSSTTSGESLSPRFGVGD